MEEGSTPLISVIVPVRNSPDHLRTCLHGLRDSTFRDFEVIVVDDASTDATPQVAEQMGVRLLRLTRQAGPATARNRGAAIASGRYLFFLDADVCVHPDTPGRVAESFAQNAKIDALFGSYDACPPAANLISQYKNLAHHFVHQQGSEPAGTFWSGCGAIRREVFRELGGFDQDYGRPCIEDIELGARLSRSGHRVVLRRDIQVTHLKKWTLVSLLRSDVLDRAIPWTLLLLRERNLPNDLNLRGSQRLSIVLVGLLLVLVVVQALTTPTVLLLPFVLLGVVLLGDTWSSPASFRGLGLLTAIGGVGGAIVFRPWMPASLILVLAVVLINLRFFRFLAARRGWGFAVLAVPLHLLYFTYCGAAFVAGVALHLLGGKQAWRARPTPASFT